ncbi:MAG: hypothetical protein K2N58_02230 [Treponemataceae bacterium]|nr:hypothetical protein [Treponemataceae bacterium]
MRSFAFWYERNDPVKEELKAVLHFNLWSECGWEDKNSVLDIGFKITNLASANELSFFCPFKVEIKNIDDLGCKFDNAELLCALFNEDYTCTSEQGTKFINVNPKNNNDKPFCIYKLDRDQNIKISKFTGGCIIKIKTEGITSYINKEKDVYFRFRIHGIKLGDLIHQYSASKKGVQELFNQTYLLDFRYNNIRSLPPSLIEEMNKPENSTVSVTKLHFLFMTKAYIDVNTSMSFPKKTRKLETSIWRNYVDDKDTEDIVAYQFSFSNVPNNGNSLPIDNAELFLKYSAQKSVAPKYILFTIILGISGSILGSGIIYLLKLLPIFKNL